MFDLLIKNGKVVIAEATFNADIGVTDGKISAIAQRLDADAARVIDANSCYVLPGAIDAHVHLHMRTGVGRTADDWRSGTIAAALGGTTTIVDFVDMSPSETMLDALAQRLDETRDAVIDFGLHMTIQPDIHAVNGVPKIISAERLAQIRGARDAGCATFKMYTAYPNFQVQSGDLYRALCAILEVDGLACIHAENGDVIDVLRERAVTRQAELPLSSAYWHALTRPPQIECESVNSVVTFAEHTGARVLIFHLGCEDAVQIIGAAKARGVTNVFGETCPQYLALTDDYLKRDDGRMWVCSPPLRTQRDQDAMWRMLRSGALDIISSDHCPYTRAQKESSRNDFRQMPGGVPGIETRLGLAHQFSVRAGHMSLGEWVRSCCTRPAEIHNLKNKGRIAVNYDADLVIFDPAIHKTLTQDQLHMNVDFSAYADLACDGWTRDVISRGEVIVERQQFVGAIGRGKFVKR